MPREDAPLASRTPAKSRRDAAEMSNERIARVLDDIADMIDLAGEGTFRAVTFRAAARAIRDLREPIALYREQGRLTEIEKVGPSVSTVIVELLDRGTAKRYEELVAKTPPGLLDLLRVPGVGPATARTIYEHLKITTIEELEDAARERRLQVLPKIQAKTEERILQSIEQLRRRSGRSLVHHALRDARALVAYLEERCGAGRVAFAGSLRRFRETIGDIDVVVATDDPRTAHETFRAYPEVERIVAQGETKSAIVLRTGQQVDLRTVAPRSWGAALVYFTGSKEHNVRLRHVALKRGLLLNEYGLYRVGEEKSGPAIAGATEEEIYAALGMDWIPPELREDRGEIDAALERRLPALVRRDEIKGDLHTHSDWTDGRDPLEAMVRRAKQLGYEYVAVTDHSISLGMAKGMTLDRVRERNRILERLDGELRPFRVFSGCEVNIRADGTLDYDDDGLLLFDVVTASIHSAMHQPKDVMTKRIVGAMRNPLVDAVSHPTGRLLERRDAYEVDVDELIRVSAETGCRLEVNGGPERLDLADVSVRRAIAAGAPLVINSDAHLVGELDWMEYGVMNARRGWATAAAVENTKPLDAMLEHIERRRRKERPR
ncbi:MAG TPA: DNA polymerase/3'-5' exonuclease PolX [Candidatus Dormibacteraeota bacterium]|nr:DNA polymerase/3'-5' exonuclease PolX [Candidatus Dormibacteraeota bacterium]